MRWTALLVLLAILPVALAMERHQPPRKVDAATEARNAFFLRSDLKAADQWIEKGLARTPSDRELLFLQMESAALQAKTLQELDAAVRLSAVDTNAQTALGIIAANRILDLAGNSAQFRVMLPRIQQAIAAGSPYANTLRAALISAASDGMPGISIRSLAHASGLLTDWRIAGPFGRYNNVAFDGDWAPEHDLLRNATSGNNRVERVRFNHGTFTLPEYFPRTGAFYAAAEVRSTDRRTRMLRVESSGTLEIFVDGKRVLLKDNRYRDSADTVAVPLRLTPGAHSLLVKFIPSALPFRIALLPPGFFPAVHEIAFPTDAAGKLESLYVNASRAYWSGDYNGVIHSLNSLPSHEAFAAGDYLLAEAWQHSTNETQNVESSLLAALKDSPAAIAADFELAEIANDAGRVNDAWQHLQRVRSAQPDFDPAQQLAARIAISQDWTVEAISALDYEVRLHPSCGALRRAYEFDREHEQFDRADALLEKTKGCAPDSTTYPELLSEAGEHRRAAQALNDIVRANPLDREARMMLVKELQIDPSAQKEAFDQLAAIAPNWHGDPNKSDQEEAARARDLVSGNAFYAPFQRDAIPIVREGITRAYTDSSAATLLDDQVTSLDDQGHVAVYVHRIIQILNRDGLETYGEVYLPANAAILELRTIHHDGSIAEPEFNEHKTSISMSALSPGDSIEEEYVVYRANTTGIVGHLDDFTHVFGSFRTPTLHSRFVAITPLNLTVVAREMNGAPKGIPSIAAGRRVQVWEQNNLAQSREERSVPSHEVLPMVTVDPVPDDEWVDIRDYYRDILIEAAHISQQTEDAVAKLNLSGKSELEKIAACFQFVGSNLRQSDESWDDGHVDSAEDTIANGSGNRTVALIAMLRATGIDADLVLARNLDSQPAIVSRGAFTYPLVRVLTQRNDASTPAELLLDAQTDRMQIGAISPTLDRSMALLVPVESRPENQSLIALTPTANDSSTAEGDIHFNDNGDLSAHIHIRLGSWRSAQIRQKLATLSSDSEDRRDFLKKIASQLIGGTASATGKIQNEQALDRPIEIILDCQAPHVLPTSGTKANLDQLVPALGLKHMYADADSRVFPLFIDAPLVENTTFRVTLPGNIEVERLVRNTEVKTPFGLYALKAVETSPNSFQITREFKVPVQVVPPEQYQNFRKFAVEIERAERQQLAVNIDRSVASKGK